MPTVVRREDAVSSPRPRVRRNTPPPPPARSRARCCGATLARWVGRTGGAVLALVTILLGLLLLDGSGSQLVDAQTTDHSTAVLLRTEIEEG